MWGAMSWLFIFGAMNRWWNDRMQVWEQDKDSGWWVACLHGHTGAHEWADRLLLPVVSCSCCCVSHDSQCQSAGRSGVECASEASQWVYTQESGREWLLHCMHMELRGSLKKKYRYGSFELVATRQSVSKPVHTHITHSKTTILLKYKGFVCKRVRWASVSYILSVCLVP